MSKTTSPIISEQQQLEIESAVFQKMIKHLRKHPEVQNIDLMNLAYFCRNCFSKWYMAAANAQGIEMNYDQAREVIYGIPFEQYKAEHQKQASEEQLALFKTSQQKATE